MPDDLSAAQLWQAGASAKDGGKEYPASLYKLRRTVAAVRRRPGQIAVLYSKENDGGNRNVRQKFQHENFITCSPVKQAV